MRIYNRQVGIGLLGSLGGLLVGSIALPPTLIESSDPHLFQVSSIEGLPVWGAQRTDTIYDAVMAHYQAQTAPGTFNGAFLKEADSPLARLFRSCTPYQGNTKVAIFCFFLGTSHQGVQWSRDAWHFFIHLLHALKLLLAGEGWE